MKKLFSTLLLSALFSIAAALPAFATGWTLENNVWVFYNYDGSKVVNDWRTASDGCYYYLDGWGNMATSTFINNERYVDADGKMVTDGWRNINGIWYYFDSNGKMIANNKRQINGVYYFFDGDGRMLTGWIEDGGDWYYCNPSDGHMFVNTWVRLPQSEDMREIDENRKTLDDDGTYWFYFQATGKAARANSTEEYKEYVINSERYCFDEAGRLVTGWCKVKDTTPSIAGYKYYNDNESLGVYGAVHTGWLATFPPEGDENLGEEVVWYYFDYKGTPYYGTDVSDSDDDETLEAKFRRIQKNGKTYTYLFNEYGNPVYGLRKVRKKDGTVTSMYFGTRQECCLQLGEKNVTEADGTVSAFSFDSNGYGSVGVKNNKLYYMGKLQKAVDDTYSYYTVNGTTYLVNRSGSIVKNYNLRKDPSDVEYRSDSRGVRDGGTADESELIVPEFQMTEIY